MEAFEPLINLFTVLTVLSIASERLSNMMKLRNPDLAVKKHDESAEKQREEKITTRAVLIAILLALLVKADFFEILSKLHEPWSTLGWVRVQTGEWVRSHAFQNAGTVIYACFGCIVTGIAMGFGSKFWHDVLDMVYQLREAAKKKAGGT
jgi:hypothetical protein